MSRNLTMEDLYDIDTKDGPKRWVAGRRIGGGRYGDAPIYMEFNVEGPALPQDAQGFNVEAMKLAEDAIWDAEAVWYDRERQRGDNRVYDYFNLPTQRWFVRELPPLFLSIVSGSFGDISSGIKSLGKCLPNIPNSMMKRPVELLST